MKPKLVWGFSLEISPCSW